MSTGSAWPKECVTDGIGSGVGVTAGVSVGGFALHEALLRRVAGVSEACVVQFPPRGGDEVAVWGGVVPKSQTTSVNNAENGVLWAKWSAFWARRCSGMVCCAHENPLYRT